MPTRAPFQQVTQRQYTQRTRFVLFWACLLLSLNSDHAIGQQADKRADLEFFEKKVRPLLVEHCYSCHSTGAKKLQAELYVDSRRSLIEGGDSGAALVPGKPDDSLFMEAVRYESYEMPPKGKLADIDIAVFEKWIRMGAPWPDEPATTKRKSRPDKFNLAERRDTHWVWQPIQAEDAPAVKETRWPVSEIDYFVLAKLEANGLKPAPDVEKASLLRRLHLDITGLPPTIEQVEAFANDSSARAIERVVDELLDSSEFGERWGRHWLDLVRYAESRGHEFDNDIPNAFQYRDYVIRALNADVPYDQFVREHIAGDLLSSPRRNPRDGFNESILGTGFWFLGEWVHSPVDIRKDEADRFDNMLDVMSKTFLGVTVACARCHDHKFDAISTADYYSLSGFLQSSDYRQVRFDSIDHNEKVADQLVELDKHYQRQLWDVLDAVGVNQPRQSSYLSNESVVFDFGNLPQREFLQDGHIFGSGPRMAGTIWPKGDGAVAVATYGAAVSDSFWNGLKSISAGVMQDQNKLSKIPASGRTLLTPTFTLKHGRVSCLVQGEGHIVACVDSHRLVNGPLHGQTIETVKAEDQWVTLDLARYVDHGLHLEFTPASGKQLSVRLVVQGLSNADLKALDQRLANLDAGYVAYAKQAMELLNGRVEVDERLFADFEGGSYEGWTVEGDAFGQKPQTQQTIGKYQGNVNHRGKWFVNSHNIRSGGDVAFGDSRTGTMISREFTINCDSIQFLVGGGPHKGQTCVNLLIDGKPVRSTTGRANNRMEQARWDVRPFAGKKAKIQIVDNHKGGWGNIGVDHIVFHTEKNANNGNLTAQRLIGDWTLQRAALQKNVRLTSRLAPAMRDGSGEDDHVLVRGNSSRPGKLEPRHFLTAISGDQPMSILRGSGRLELAAHINDPNNPLTSRVLVNRVWHHLMGRGIVPTTDDFGVLGLRPTHPKLLDHLAASFEKDGRSIKRLIRYIVLSHVYRMSGEIDPRAAEADPTNLLWHHRPPKRLEGESIRDSLLMLSGRLNPQQFGPAVPIHLTSFMDGKGRPHVSGPLDGGGRRSIYVALRRNFLSPFMLAFDSPVPFSTMGRRNVSNVPAQALILMNDPFVAEQSAAWAMRALSVSGTAVGRVRWLYQSAFARQPTNAELEAATAYVGESDSPATWAELAHVLINTKEFIFVR